MTTARRSPVETDGSASGLTVHPHWRRHISGVGGPAVCDIRPATPGAIGGAAALLRRAGCADAERRHADGSILLLFAWADPDRLPADRPVLVTDRVAEAGATAPGSRRWTREAPRLWVAGCLEIDWAGPADADVRHAAGDCVELRALWVQSPARGQGVGRALVAAAEDICLAAGRPRVVAALPTVHGELMRREKDGGGHGGPLAAAIGAGYSTLAVRRSGGAASMPESGSPAGPAWVWKDVPDTAAADRRRARAAVRPAAAGPR